MSDSRPIYFNACSSQVFTSRYRPPRLEIGPDTRTLKLEVQRNAGFKTQKEMKFQLIPAECVEAKKPECPVLENYAYTDGVAYFDTTAFRPFKVAGFKRYFIYNNQTCIGAIEIVVAPSLSIKGAETAESECAESSWVEPVVEVDDCAEAECGSCKPSTCSTTPLCDVDPVPPLRGECDTPEFARMEYQ